MAEPAITHAYRGARCRRRTAPPTDEGNCLGTSHGAHRARRHGRHHVALTGCCSAPQATDDPGAPAARVHLGADHPATGTPTPTPDADTHAETDTDADDASAAEDHRQGHAHQSTKAGPKPTPGNPLTGGKVTANPVVAVKIDNTSAGRPQYGISQADVVYIEQVEGGLTRMMAVFHTHLPTEVGPVRSVRTTDVELLPLSASRCWCSPAVTAAAWLCSPRRR